MAERFEIPLALALICFTLELLIRPYRRKVEQHAEGVLAMNSRTHAAPKKAAAATALMFAALAWNAAAADAHDLSKEGLALYSKKEYAAAGEKFDAAEKAVPAEQRETAARAAYDTGCALQKKGDVEKARDAYKKATAARDKVVASSAQFNLGQLAATEGKDLAGAQPEQLPQEKRTEVIAKLRDAVERFRSCLDINPEYADARRNIEVIRQWLKLYTNKWAALDRQKRRDEMNLFQFIDYIAQTERGLRGASRSLGEYPSADECAELKRAQDELSDEIEPLKAKIEKEIAASGQQPQQQGAPPPAPNPEQDKEKETAIKTLKEWANNAGKKMLEASGKLVGAKPSEAMELQKESAQTLDRMWEALAPFNLQLPRDLAEQTQIVNVLKPESEDAKGDDLKDKKDGEKKDEVKKEPVKKADPAIKNSDPEYKNETADLADLQTDVSRRTMQLKVKAERELTEMEKNAPKPAEGVPTPDKDKEKDKKWLTQDDLKLEEAKKKLEEAKKKSAAAPGDPKADDKKADAPPTPEEIKKGLQKAVELAPKAVEKMNAALEHLKKDDRDGAIPDAEEAKKICRKSSMLNRSKKRKMSRRKTRRKTKTNRKKMRIRRAKTTRKKRREERRQAGQIAAATAAKRDVERTG